MANAQETTGLAVGRPNPLEGMTQFLKETWAELHRVQWPTQETVIKHTVVVVSFVVFMALYVGAWDAVFTWLFRNLLHIRTGGS